MNKKKCVLTQCCLTALCNTTQVVIRACEQTGKEHFLTLSLYLNLLHVFHLQLKLY